MEVIKGYVEHIIYQNSENGYTVLELSVDGDAVTCVGSLPFISEGELIEASGSMTVHSSYGEQFKIDSYETMTPEDALAIERYLGSGAIKGIGAALAGRIVRRFGDQTFHIIEQEPERLAEIRGISEKKAREIAAQVEEKKDMRQAMLFLSNYGISTALSIKIYQRYGNEIYRIIKENPYRLADDIEGIGFRIADEIARRAGILADSDFRVRSGILYILQQASTEGHIYLPEKELEQRTSLLLEAELDDIEVYLADLAIERKITVKRDGEDVKVYGSRLFYLEQDTAMMLHDLNVTGQVKEEQIMRKISAIEEETNTTLDELQALAVREAVRCGLLVLTGGPGTGKTTTINTMIRYFESEGLKIELAAPTGRAAKRMTESSGFEARTIHRLLEVSGGQDGSSGVFGRDDENPLEADVIIVDEMSMVDIYLMHALLKAITVGTRLIMVGDVNQLPSVGPGSVLKDIIESECVNVVCLTHIFRQAQESDIVVNAHKINHGDHPVINNKSKDFFFLQRPDVNRVISVAIQLISEKLPRYVNAAPEEIQVLTPTRKGLVGVERLNKIFQEYLNPVSPDKRECTHGDLMLREGDKVMQIRNNYQAEWEVRGRYGAVVDHGTGVFNGDLGKVAEINPLAETVTVEFDEHRFLEYPYAELDQLELAYAVTIHKSQGSEYPAVIIPMMSGPRMLMNRNLIYTAVTRAKSCVVLVGEQEIFYQMIDNTSEQKRYTSLSKRLREYSEM